VIVSQTKSQAQIDAFVADLKKTKGGVQVREEDGETIVTTRDGDVHRFKTKKAD
jgi:hypothetical protein